MKPKQLTLLRHGQSLWNLENKFTGWVDVPLSDTGRNEAKVAGELICDEGIEPHVLFTSMLDRAIHTSEIALRALHRSWIPVARNWRLNERHYGALQGLDKSETAKIHGEDQVKVWRRSFDVPPPAVDRSDSMHPANDSRYKDIPPEDLPSGESLELTRDRVMPYFHKCIVPAVQEGQSPLVVAHGNSLRSIVMMLDGLSSEDVLGLNIPTGVPLTYEFDSDGSVVSKRYLGDQDAIHRKIQEVAQQGASK